MQITKNTVATRPGPGEWFTGAVFIDAVATPSGVVRLQWGATVARMALIRDGRTGEILSFARGSSAQIRTGAADLEVTLSDGIRSTRRKVRVNR